MPDREKVIKGLTICKEDSKLCFGESECGYQSYFPRCWITLASDALDLLQTQESRVMTLDELRLIGNRNPEHIWPLDTPPYLWMEINPYFRRSNGFWVAWRDVLEMLTNVNPTFVADNYDKLWRCFAIKPTKDQVKGLKWERSVKKK